MHGLKRIFEKYPLHTLLLGLYPAVTLLAGNIDKTPISHAINPALVSMLGGLVLWGMFYAITRSYRSSALSASWFIFLFFFYGYAFKLTHEAFQHRYLLLVWGLLFCTGVFCAYRLKKFDRKITYIVNSMVSVLVVLSVGQIAAYELKTYITEQPLPDHITTFNYGTVTPPDVLPDIYYIIIDAYASEWSFREFYKFDISKFTSYLTDRGFYVVPKTTSNYSKTVFSLSSQLNMDYLDKLLGVDESVLVSSLSHREAEAELGRLIEDNRLIHFMKSQGYRTIHVGSPWTYTLRNKYADENINLQPIPFDSEFSLILFNTTALKPISEKIGLLDNRKLQWKRIQYEFDEVAGIASRPEPTYVFAHFDIPHWPYVFDVDGSFVPADVEHYERSEKENYMRQVQYLNTALPKMIDQILEQSVTPPIIVLQSDHGSASAPLHDTVVLTTKGAERDFVLQEGMRNFSAILLPGKERGVLPENLTPVNVWRVILNTYFGTNLEILPNKNFFKVTNVPGFIIATDVVKYE